MLVVHDDRIDGRSGIELERTIRDLVDRGHVRIVVDLGNVRFMDSTGLGALVRTLKLVGRDGDLSVARLQEGLAILFKLTRMDRVIRTHLTVEDAVRADEHPPPDG